MCPDSPGRQRLLTALAALIVVAAVVLVSPWHLTDPDALSHLTIGRTIVQHGGVPSTDPLTFPLPDRRWSNPEWLGDLLLHAVYSAAGETGLQLFKLLIICIGWVLVLRLALRRGAAPLLTAAILLLMLMSSTIRFTLRNHIHVYWLIPLYGLVLLRSRERRRWLLALLPLGVLWANLHGSFIVGWVVVGAALARELVQRGPARPALAGILALHPLLGMVSPHGWHNYGQVLDHLLGSGIYRTLILEWQPPSQQGLLVHLPLHLMGLAGLLSFMPRENRRRVEPFLLVVAGLALAYSSRRFVPLMAVLTVPAVAANLSRFTSRASGRFRRVAHVAALVLGVGLLAPVIWLVRTEDRNPHLLRRPGAPIAVSRFLAASAPAGTRLFNPFNAGPWLLWEAARCDDDCSRGARVRLYIDPRNNLGAEALKRYYEQVRARPAVFDEEARRLEMSLALLDLTDGRTLQLNAHLDRAAAWRLVYLDGRYAVYARAVALNRGLLEKHAYRLVRARLGFEYLLASGARDELEADLRQLRGQGPALARALEGYRLLVRGGGAPPRIVGARQRATDRQARKLLEQALPQLPPTPFRLVYLATAMARLGDRGACDEVLDQARALFPGDPMVLGLEAELARSEGKLEQSRAKLRALRASPAHPVWKVMGGGRLEVP